jgi:peptidoglycan/LPS O-acetylase OafA/YrhL
VPKQVDPNNEKKPTRGISFVISNWTMVGLDIPSLFHFKADTGFLFFYFPHPENAPDGAKWAGEFRTIEQAWSIGVEIWFYLIAPFLVALRSRWIVLIGVASIVLKSVMIQFGLQTYFFFPAQLCFFMAGMLLHRAYVTNSFGKLDQPIGYGVLTVVVVLVMFFDRLPKPIADYVIYAALIPAIPILFDLTRKSRFDIALGNLSYPIYIVHLLIISMAFNMLNHTNININQDVIALTIMMSVLVASIILYLVIEKPVDEIRQRRAAGVRLSSPAFAQANMTVQPDATCTLKFE